MANKRNNANSVKYNNLKSQSDKASDDSPLFDDEKIEDTTSDDGVKQPLTESENEILKEIEKVMAEGSYNQGEREEIEDEEEDEPQVFVTNDISLANRSEKGYLLETAYAVKEKKRKSTLEKSLTAEQLEKKAKREAKKAAYKKTTFKHKLKVVAVLMVLGVFTGSGLGVWYFNFALNSNVDYSADPNDYVQSVDETLARNFNGIDSSNMETWVTQAKAQGKTPADLSPVDNYVLAEYNASLASSYTVVGVGSILTMGFDQYMYSERKFDGSKYSFVSISPTTNSFVGDIAVCDIMQKGSNSIASYVGVNDVEKGDTTAEWNYSTSYDTEAYESFAGVMVDSLTPYIIGEKTVLSSSEITTDENGNYVFTLELNTVSSVLRYVKQVKRTGDLALMPVFNEIKQTITITSDWQLVSIDIEEKYSAIKMGVNAPINSSMTTNFTFNEPVTLPSVPPA